MLFGLMFCLAATAAQAASINYGDFGPDFPPGATKYINVTESSGTDAVPLFHPPSLSGDVLDFDPKGFVASATAGSGDNTDGQLNFDFSVLPGAGMTSLLVGESGDFSLFGAGTAATSVAAGLSISIEILEVDGIVLSTPISTFASSSTTRDLVTDGPVLLASWSNSLLIDLGSVLTANNIDFQLGVTKAKVVIDDLLIALSESQSSALIAKKDFTITPSIQGNPIPEPASLALFAIGAACLFRRGDR
jgi:hypothetical protein